MKLKAFILFILLPFHLLMAQTTFGWGSIDVRYSRSEVPTTSKKCSLLRAWRGERVSAQAVLATSTDLNEVSFTVSNLKCGKKQGSTAEGKVNIIPASAVKTYFVREVMAEPFYNKKDSMMCADRLEPAAQILWYHHPSGHKHRRR